MARIIYSTPIGYMGTYIHLYKHGFGIPTPLICHLCAQPRKISPQRRNLSDRAQSRHGAVNEVSYNQTCTRRTARPCGRILIDIYFCLKNLFSGSAIIPGHTRVLFPPFIALTIPITGCRKLTKNGLNMQVLSYARLQPTAMRRNVVRNSYHFG